MWIQGVFPGLHPEFSWDWLCIHWISDQNKLIMENEQTNEYDYYYKHFALLIILLANVRKFAHKQNQINIFH